MATQILQWDRLSALHGVGIKEGRYICQLEAPAIYLLLLIAFFWVMYVPGEEMFQRGWVSGWGGGYGKSSYKRLIKHV